MKNIALPAAIVGGALIIAGAIFATQPAKPKAVTSPFQPIVTPTPHVLTQDEMARAVCAGNGGTWSNFGNHCRLPQVEVEQP